MQELVKRFHIKMVKILTLKTDIFPFNSISYNYNNFLNSKSIGHTATVNKNMYMKVQICQ